MYMKDKTQTITVRLNAEQYEFLRNSAKAIEVTPSKLLRMVVNGAMTSAKAGAQAGAQALAKAGESLEHGKTDRHDLVEH